MIVYPDYAFSDEPAERVLAQMRALLDRRRCLKVSRCEFLSLWKNLRRRLERTAEYRAFREAVLIRDRRRCRSCGRPAGTVHHRRRVARNIDLALAVSNGEVRCTDCHRASHRCLRRTDAA